MEGHWMRLNRLFSDGKRAVIVAADRGEFLGPSEGIIELPRAIEAFGEADGILLSPGMLRNCGHAFSYRGAPMAIVRLDWSTVFCDQWDYQSARAARVISPQEALALGAEIGFASLTLTTTDERIDRESVELFAELLSARRTCGLPLVGQFCPVSPHLLTADQLFSQIHPACRIIAELGADAIATYFTGERFAETVEACPIPILCVEAQKLPREIDALELAQRAIKAGARGVVFGRNVFQAAHPAKMVQALRAVVKQDAEPAEAAREAGL